MSDIADVQSLQDGRDLPIDQVGIKALLYPISILDGQGEVQHSVAEFDLSVRLPAHAKGTHMSRFIEALETYGQTFSLQTLQAFMQKLHEKMDAERVFLVCRFPYFIRKRAPKSGRESLMDYQVSLRAAFGPDHCNISVQLVVPVKTLCPASKKMSAYGAHNQRSHITLDLTLNDTAHHFEYFIQLAEQQASSELFAVLKRADEKAITEQAYDNPKFVEDLTRDIALKLKVCSSVKSFSVTCENFESIHNHSAFARISG